MSQPSPAPFAAPARLSTPQLRQRVAIRTVAIAALAGRAPQNVNQNDYEQAKRDVVNEFARDQAHPPRAAA